MSILYDRIIQMEQDPRFKKLTYKEQVNARSTVFSSYIQSQGETSPFHQAKPEQQKEIIDSVILRHPIFNNVNFENMGEWALYKHMSTNEDEEVRDRAWRGIQSTIVGNAMVENIFLMNLMKGLVFSLVGVIVNNDTFAQDYNKMFSFFDAKLASNEDFAGTTNVAKNLLGGVSMIADIASLYSVGVGSLAKPKGLVNLLMKPINRIDKTSRLVAKVYTAVVHSIGGGAVGVLREGLKEWAGQIEYDRELSDIMYRAIGHFSEYAVGDLLFFGAAGFLKNYVKALGYVFPKTLGRVNQFTDVLLGKGWVSSKKLVSGALLPQTPGEILDILKEVTKGNIDPAQYRAIIQQAPSQKAILDTLTVFGKIGKNVEKKTALDLLQLAGLAGNHPVEIIGDQLKVFYDNKVLGVYNTIDDASKAIFDHINTFKVSAQKITDINVIGAGMENASVKEIVTGNVMDGIDDNLDILTQTIAPNKGIFQTTDVTAFSKGYLKGFNIPGDVVSSITSKVDGNMINLNIGGTEIASIPNTVFSGIQEKEAVGTLIDALNKIIPEGSVANNKALKDFLNFYSESSIKQELFTPSWVESAASEFYDGFKRNPDGTYITLKDGIEATFDNVQDLGFNLVKKTTSVARLQQFLDTSFQGVKLNEVKDGSLQLIKSGDYGFKETFKNIEDLLTAHPEYIPKISSEFAPIFGLIDNTKKNVEYTGKVASGTYQDILMEFDKFHDFKNQVDNIVLYSGTDGTLSVTRLGSEFEVYLPEFGYRKRFETHGKAMSFLRENHNNFADLFQMSAEKGYRLGTTNGKFVLYSDVDTFFPQNIDQLKAQLRDAPIPKYMPKTSGLDPAIFKDIPKNLDYKWKPKDYPTTIPKGSTLSKGWYIGQFTRPVDRQLVKAAEQGFLGDKAIGLFRASRDMEKAMTGNMFKQIGGLEAAFTDVWSKGKARALNKKERINLLPLITTSMDNWTDDVIKNLGIPEAHVEVAKNIRSYINDLGNFFGISPDKWITEYLPLIKAGMNKPHFKASNYTDGMMHEFLRDTAGIKAKDLTPFFRYDRVSDIIKYIKEQDPMTLMTKYVIAGNKEKFLSPILKDIEIELGNILKANKGEGLNDAALRLAKYLSDMGGVPKHTFTREQLNKAFTGIFTKLGTGGGSRGEIINKLTSMGYLATMAGRPWLAIRNMHQIFTTLGPRIGNSYVDDAMRILANDTDGSIFKLLKEKGIMQLEIPLAGGQYITDQGKLGWLAKKGLKNYRNADEFTRAVAYVAAEQRFQRALNTSDITSKKFWSKSGTSLMDADIQKQIQMHLSKGDSEAAKYLFASHIVDETMFPYKPGMSNILDKGGTVAQLFSQYGHYSLWYRANVMRGFTNGTLAQKIGFATRWLGNGAALTAGFAALGIGAAHNFIPWAPMTFTGGPYYEFVNNILSAAGGGWTAKVSLKSILNLNFESVESFANGLSNSQIFLAFTPTAYQLRSMYRGFKDLSEGNVYRGLLQLTSAPVTEDNPWDYLWDNSLGKAGDFIRNIVKF